MGIVGVGLVIFIGCLYVVICGVNWLDTLLVPTRCIDDPTATCVGLAQRAAFLSVLFFAISSVLFLILRLLVQGYNRNIYWRDDSRERIAFANVYIKMLGNPDTNVKTNDHARIVYEVLFRPAQSKAPSDDVSVGVSLPDAISNLTSKSP